MHTSVNYEMTNRSLKAKSEYQNIEQKVHYFEMWDILPNDIAKVSNNTYMRNNVQYVIWENVRIISFSTKSIRLR